MNEKKPLRAVEGTFLPGESGNPRGRPKGSKNKVTLYKLLTEEAFRARNQDKIDEVLDSIVEDALNGDKGAKKMIWDASVSKANVQEDKSAGHTQKITVHKMTVGKDVNPEEEETHE